MTTALIAWSAQHAGLRSEPVPYRSDTAVQAAAPGGWSSSPPSPKRRSSGPREGRGVTSTVEDGPNQRRSLLLRVARDHQSLGNSRRVWEERSSVILNPLMRQCD